MVYYLINNESTNQQFRFTNKKELWKKRVEIERLGNHWTVYMIRGNGDVISNNPCLAYYPR